MSTSVTESVSMSENLTTDLCRLTIVTATQRVDLAVPVRLSVSELLTIVVSSLGPEAVDLGMAQGGWTLQRLGENPLEPAASLVACRVLDGDVLHLRTRVRSMPALVFDDVLDAVADVVTRTRRWQEPHTALAAALSGAAALILAASSALRSGPSWTTPATMLGVGAAVLVITAITWGRNPLRRAPALVAGGLAIAYGAACGAVSVGGHHRLGDFGAAQLCVGACAGLLVATGLLVAIALPAARGVRARPGPGTAGLVAVATVLLLATIGTGVVVLTSQSGAAAAAVVAGAGLTLSPFVPATALRLSRLPALMPHGDADDPGAFDVEVVRARTARADQYLTGLVGGVALGVAGASALLAGHGPSENGLALVCGGVCLLRARLFSGRGQRFLLLGSGGGAVSAAAFAATLDVHGAGRLVIVAAVGVVVGLGLLALSVVLPGRRHHPGAARAIDAVDSALVLAVVPLTLAVLGVFGAIHRLGG